MKTVFLFLKNLILGVHKYEIIAHKKQSKKAENKY